jgi:pantoate--beta-alanine ligase
VDGLKTVRSKEQMRVIAERWRCKGLRVGFVPTMGALHAGHLALVKASLAECDRTVASIFVNPMQFGPREDFNRYPRPLARDRGLLAGQGVHILFAPSATGMYPAGFSSRVEVDGSLVARLCGSFRPGHFAGVTTVVAKLFNIIRPDIAFFGAKDAQQAAVVSRMAVDLDFSLVMRIIPTVREKDGLAMSSRNRFLSAAQRAAAPCLYRALAAGRAAVARGERRPAGIRNAVRRVLSTEPELRLQYLEIVDALTFAPVSRLEGRILLAAAAWLGKTRLIDNLGMRIPGRRGIKGK